MFTNKKTTHELFEAYTKKRTHKTQLRASFLRYGSQLIRVKASLIDLLLIPITCAFLLYFALIYKQQPAIFAFVLVGFSHCSFVRVIIGDLVYERNEKLKELLIMKGLFSYYYQLGVLLFALVKSVLTGLPYLLAFLLASQNFWQTMNFYLFFVLTGIGLASFTLMISVFFSNPNIAIQLGTVIFVCQFFGFLIEYKYLSSAPLIQLILGLFPSTPLSWTILELCNLLNFQAECTLYYRKPPFSTTVSLTVLVFDIFLYYILFRYLDAVIPNGGEVKKSLLFCLGLRKRKVLHPSKGLLFELQDPVIEASPSTNENATHQHTRSTSALYHEDTKNHQKKNTVRIKNLSKSFSFCERIVVDNISFDLFDEEIFCLVGQNGAGKTTMMHMLTGFLQQDSGQITYNERDFTREFDTIRLNIGFCAQKNILFNYMSVREHIILYALLQGFQAPQISLLVEELLQRSHLLNEAETLAVKLSEGIKRKLSICISLIGEPKVIFLDEPTTGLDPDSRRSIWIILKELRAEGKTIVLTTQYLEEAEELSDRIGVLTRGKLLCLGSTNFIKKKFGIGYHLTITLKGEKMEVINAAAKIEKKVTDHVTNAIRIDCTTENVLKYLLPLIQQPNFEKLFLELEQCWMVDHLNLHMNSLEDAFLNIQLLEKEEEIKFEEEEGSQPFFMPEQNYSMEYNFWDQFGAMFKRKLYQTVRSPEIIMFYFSPVFFIFAGLLYLFVIHEDQTKDETPFKEKKEDYHRMKLVLTYTLEGFGLSSSIYLYEIVKEKQEKVKHILKIMGCKTLPYWMGSFAADSIISLFVSLGVSFFSGLSLNEHFLHFFTLVYVYMLNMVAMGYLWSWFFSSTLNSQKYFGILTTLFLNHLPLYCALNWNLAWLRYSSYLFSPMGIFFDATLDLYRFHSFPYSYAILMICMTVIYLAFSIFIDLWTSKNNQNMAEEICTSQNNSILVDQNIIVGEHMIDENGTKNDSLVKVAHMKKIFGNSAVVLDVSFDIKKKEIFGLLGPNGAGKSTIFDVISALAMPTSGFAELLSKEVGICPQFNYLWGKLSVKEHFFIYGQIKGLKPPGLNKTIETFMRSMNLSDNSETIADRLSGGNKRKLCVALALLANPKILLLDDPFTGLDPVARKSLGKILTNHMNQNDASIVLTTHSMSEAESLCTRLAILINGKIVWQGAGDEIKANGYILILRSNRLNQHFMLDIAQQVSSNAIQIQDGSELTKSFHLPECADFSFSKAYTILESMKMKSKIENFSLYNTNLEQIYLQFSKIQVHNKGVPSSLH